MNDNVNKTLLKSAWLPHHINDLVYQYHILAAQWSYVHGRDCTEEEKLDIKKALLRSMARRVGNSKYAPHQGIKERARRVKQITGTWVDEA